MYDRKIKYIQGVPKKDYVEVYTCAGEIEFQQVQFVSCWNKNIESFVLSQDLEAS